MSNNGHLTFNQGQGTYTPSGLGAGYGGQPIIAAFFADVDTRAAASGVTSYGTGTYAGRTAFGATWPAVGCFPSAADKLNSFQIILTDRSDTGAANFDIYFNYDIIQWETGGASGGSNGLGGTSAAAGFNAGSGNAPGTLFQLAGSLVNGAFLDGGPNALAAGSNIGVPGQFLFNVRNGAGGGAEPGAATNNGAGAGEPGGAGLRPAGPGGGPAARGLNGGAPCRRCWREPGRGAPGAVEHVAA